MKAPDDSAIFHSRVYDPAKARAYYLRTRHLKGRRAGMAQPPAHKTSPRQQELAAQKAALEKRLARLKNVLAELVDAAKSRSGVKKTEPDPHQSPAEQAKERASQNEADKKAKPLTAQQKREKAAADRKRYQQDHPSAAKELVQLQAQIRDIRVKIEAAIENARKQAAMSKHQTALKGR